MTAGTWVAPKAGILTQTERNWLLAVLVVGALVLVFAGLAALETALGHVDRSKRFVYNAFESATRYFAIAHILVGTSFLATSRGMRKAGNRWAFAGLAVAGILICWLFQSVGGKMAHVPTALFYAYFFVHEIRDEAFFYRANGDAHGEDEASTRRDVFWIPGLVLAILLAVFLVAGAWGIGGARRYANDIIGDWSQSHRIGLGAAIAVSAAGFVHWGVLRLRRRHGSILRFARHHRPILVVYLGTFALIFGGVLLTGRLSLIVAIHVAAWYVFATRRLAAAPPSSTPPRRFSWRWMRSTQAGFQTLHLGLLVVLMVVGWVWAHAFGNDPSQHVMWALVSRDVFPYWTLMHVTLSFTPR